MGTLQEGEVGEISRGRAQFMWAVQPQGRGDLGKRRGVCQEDGLWEGSGLASEGGLLVERKWVATDELLLCQVSMAGTVGGDLLAKPSVTREFSGIWDSFLPWLSHHFSSPTFLCKS